MENKKYKLNSVLFFSLIQMSKWFLYDFNRNLFKTERFIYDKRFIYIMYRKILCIKNLNLRKHFFTFVSRVDLKDNMILNIIESFVKVNKRRMFTLMKSNYFTKVAKNKLVKFNKFVYLSSSFLLFSCKFYSSYLRIFKYKEYIRTNSKEAFLRAPRYFMPELKDYGRLHYYYLALARTRFYLNVDRIILYNLENKVSIRNFSELYKGYFYRLKTIKWIKNKYFKLFFHFIKSFYFKTYLKRWLVKFLTSYKRIHDTSRKIKLYRIDTIYAYYKFIGFDWFKYFARELYNNNFTFYNPGFNLNFIFNNDLTFYEVSSYYIMKKVSEVYLDLTDHLTVTWESPISRIDFRIWEMLKMFAHIKFVDLFLDNRLSILPYYKHLHDVELSYNLDFIMWEVCNSRIYRLLQLKNLDYRQIVLYKNIRRYERRKHYLDKKIFYIYFDMKKNVNYIDFMVLKLIQDFLLKIIISNYNKSWINLEIRDYLYQRKLVVWQILCYERCFSFARYNYEKQTGIRVYE